MGIFSWVDWVQRIVHTGRNGYRKQYVHKWQITDLLLRNNIRRFAMAPPISTQVTVKFIPLIPDLTRWIHFKRNMKGTHFPIFQRTSYKILNIETSYNVTTVIQIIIIIIITTVKALLDLSSMQYVLPKHTSISWNGHTYKLEEKIQPWITLESVCSVCWYPECKLKNIPQELISWKVHAYKLQYKTDMGFMLTLQTVFWCPECSSWKIPGWLVLNLNIS